MKLLFISIATIILAILTGCNFLKHNRDRTNLIRNLDKQIVNLDFKRISASKEILFDHLNIPDKVKIIALGEACHGAKGFFELKLDLLQYMAVNKDFRFVGYEFSFRKSLAINRYIQGEDIDIDSLISGFYWIQRNSQLLGIFKWMRDYNESASPNERLSFFGIDNQTDMLHLRDVVNEFKHTSPALYNKFEADISGFLKYEKIRYHEMDSTIYQDIKSKIKSFNARLASCPESENQEHILFKHLIESLEGSHDFLYDIYQNRRNPRDKQLAGNAIWLSNLADNGKALIWAHNAHVARNPLYNEKDGGSMGIHLKEELGKAYLPVGTSFSRGSFIAVTSDKDGKDTPPMVFTINEDPPVGSSNYLFSHAKWPEFYLDMRDLDKGDAILEYLDTTRPFIDIGDFYFGSPEKHYKAEYDGVINLYRAFDIMIHINEVSHTKLLEK